MHLFKIYLKKEWWKNLLFYAVPIIIWTEGYVYPELRFEFDFLLEPITYLNLSVYFIIWSLIWFFIFWKPNYLLQQKNAEANSQEEENSRVT